ncbi:MAG: hypothetical protein LLG42_13265 [Chloroflexi bacterium]|nr:hypothetical protein [Chloroflexota bacterium]
MKEITIFTAPKPFINPHVITIQRNAIRSWVQLGGQVEVFLIGDEPGIKEAAADLGVFHIPDVQRNSTGTPLISSIFSVAREQSQARLLAYVNADILLMKDFLKSSIEVAAQMDEFLIAGRRWDLDVQEEITFTEDWEEELFTQIKERGRLHGAKGSDYFVYPKTCYKELPDFAVGRAGWDNWMLFQARWMKWPLINATGAINIVHQQHDYGHLPNGQKHYRLPESWENTVLAGGREATLFKLRDCSHVLKDGKVRPAQMTWKRFGREIEIFPLTGLHSHALGKVFYAICHPRRAWLEFRKKRQEQSDADD